MWTLFQVFTFESWSEAIARPLLFDESWARAIAACLFFPTYIFLNSILLLNVLTSIAVEAITSASEFDLSRKTLQKMELKKSLRREKLLGSKNMRRLIARKHAALVKDDKRYQAAQAAATCVQRNWRMHKVRKDARRQREKLRREIIPQVTLDNAGRIKNIEKQLVRLLTAQGLEAKAAPASP